MRERLIRMTENLDALLSKIRTEGVDAAKQEAADIVAKAKAEAADIIAKAKAEATAMTDQAQADAQRMAMGAEATIRQAARDVLLKLGQDVTALLEQTLGGAVDETLKTPAIIEKVVVDAIAAYQRSGEVTIAAGEEVVAALKAKLAKQKDVMVVTDTQIGSGFRVRLAGGRVEHDFTGDSVTAALAALLRPQLAKLLKD
jgi:V/A-type H+-transporting ATPase subunit E